MRVAQLVETLEQGGAEKLVVEISRARLEAGDQSHIIVLSRLGPFSGLVAEGVRIHEIGFDPSRPLSLLASLFRLIRLMRNLDLDVLQTHLPRANFFGFLVCWPGGPRFFPTIHNNREFDYGDMDSAFRGWARRFVYKRMLVHSRRMIAVSPAAREAMIRELGLVGRWRDRIVVVPNGTRVPAPLGESVRMRVRAEFGVSPAEALIVGLGRLTPQKNFQDLVEALARIAGNGPPFKCIIAGSGEERETLLNLVARWGLADRVRLPGHVQDTAGLLGAADIFCMPSLWEGMPLALLEAMAAGLPVVGYAIDGVREVVQEERDGLLAGPGDVAGLADNLDRLLNDPGTRLAFGRSARTRIESEFDFVVVAKMLGAVYAS